MRLTLIQKIAAWIAVSIVSSTGIAWFVLHDLVEVEPGETERLLLMFHGISAYAVLIVIGSLLPLHVRSGWHRARKRWSGGSTLAIFTLLGVTGLILYYGGEQTREPARWIHIGIGIACAALFPIHAKIAAAAKRLAPASSQSKVLELKNRYAAPTSLRR